MDERSFSSAQEFLFTTKLFWTRELYGQLKEVYQAAVDARGASVSTEVQVGDLLAGNTTYQFFAWFERHLQQQKYSGRYGLVDYMAERRGSLLKELDDTADERVLRLDPDLKMPPYYSAVDFHQHPGGIWSDELGGLIYECGARTTTPTLGAKHADLHERFTALVCANQKPARVLDLGCGFGKSTQPFCRLLPHAEIKGIDLAAPCLKLAAHTAVQDQARNVRFAQGDACATAEPAGSYDLVTSTMLLHELPVEAVQGVFREANRVLQKGGRMVHLDFYILTNPFDRFIHNGHSERNNEPYMRPLAEADLKRLVEDSGFANVEIMPFAESDAPAVGWRFPWTVIAATKA